jgi:hypothetical protein
MSEINDPAASAHSIYDDEGRHIMPGTTIFHLPLESRDFIQR